MPGGDERAGFIERDDEQDRQCHSPKWDEGHHEEEYMPTEDYVEQPVGEYQEEYVAQEPLAEEGWDESRPRPLFLRGRGRARARVRIRGHPIPRGRGSAPPSLLSLRSRGRPPFRARGGRW
jgi:hypothetical protein